MPKTAFLCVGEGSQRVGMGADIIQECQKAADIFMEASEASGLEIFSLCTQGPAEELDLTQNAHPCLATISLAIAAALQERGVKPDCVAGVGPGEYAAHALAGTIDIERAIMLVSRRGAMLAMAKGKGEAGLEQAAKNMNWALRGTLFMEPAIKLYCCATAAPLVVKDVNSTLLDTITGPGRWEDTLAAMMDDGVTRFIECGPGKKLTDDVLRVAADKGVQVEAICIGDAIDLGLFANNGTANG